MNEEIVDEEIMAVAVLVVLSFCNCFLLLDLCVKRRIKDPWNLDTPIRSLRRENHRKKNPMRTKWPRYSHF